MKRRLQNLEQQLGAWATPAPADVENRVRAVLDTPPPDDLRTFLAVCERMGGPEAVLPGLPPEFSMLDDEGNVRAAGDPGPVLADRKEWALYCRIMQQIHSGFPYRLSLWEEESEWIRNVFPNP